MPSALETRSQVACAVAHRVDNPHNKSGVSLAGVPVALRSQPASGLAANASSASGVTKDMGPEAMEKVEQELQEPTRKSNTEKNR